MQIANNKLIQQLSEKWRITATKLADNFCKNNDIKTEEEFYKKYFQEYKKLSAEDCEIVSKEFANFAENSSWKFFINLIDSMSEPEFDNATFTEKQAFLGYRKQIIDEILNLPKEFVEYYKGIHKE